MKRKELKVLSVACLASSFVIGPIGMIAALLIYSQNAEDDKVKNRREIEFNVRPSLSSSGEVIDVESYPIPTQSNFSLTGHGFSTPQTELARRVPKETNRMLDLESRRSYYVEGLQVGSKIVKSYLNELSPGEYKRVNRISVFPEQQSKFFGIPLGRKSLEVKIRR